MVVENYSHEQWKLRKKALDKYAEILRELHKAAIETGKIIKVNSCCDLPSLSGVYFLYDNDELVYIGQSINLRRRLKNHHVYKPGHTIHYWLMDRTQLRPIEWALIAIYHPKGQRKQYLDTNYLNNFDIEDITGIKYTKKRLYFHHD